jgi:hypothetical protein
MPCQDENYRDKEQSSVIHCKLNHFEKGGVKRGSTQVSECMERCRNSLDILVTSSLARRPHGTGMFLQSISCSKSGLQTGFGRPRA